MGFQSYWQGLKPDEKRQLAEEAETSVGYLALVAGGHRKVGPNLARRLVAASCALAGGGRRTLRLDDLRPDWAELTGS